MASFVKHPLAAIVVGLLLTTGCLKTEEFPPEPRIAFKSFEQAGGTADLTITFTDCDGDIGLQQSDTQYPFGSGDPYYSNFVFDVYRKVNGTWTGPITGSHRIPVITPTGQNKTLEGEIKRTIEGGVQIPGVETDWWRSLYISDPNPPLQGDTLRMDVRLIDRALHTSNVATTGDIILQ